MSFSKKAVFTKARTKAFEKAAAALQVIIPTFTTPQEVVPFMASIPPVRKELEDVHETCKKYYDEWLAFLEELERKKDPNFNTESRTLNDLLQKPEEGIQACFDKCNAGIKHLIDLYDQLPGIMNLLFQQQNNPPPPHPNPSAPVDDTSNSVPEPPPAAASATENVTPDPPANGAPPSTTIPVVNQPNDTTKNVTSDPAIPSTNTVQQPLYPSIPSTPSMNPSLPPASTAPSNQPLHQHAQQYQFYNFPKMEFPTFNGNPTDYEYWKSSIAVIHNHPHMDPATKMKMVTDLLRGKAKEAVRYFDICAANYDLVMDELYERFGKRELVFESLFNEFANIKVQSNDIKDIATAVFAMEKIFKQLQTHNFPIDEHTYRILYREKIPPHILQQVNFYGLDPSFAELRQRVVLVVRSLTEIPNSQQYNAQHQNFQHHNVQRQHIPRRNPTNNNTHQQRPPHQNAKPLMAPDNYRTKDDRNRPRNKTCVFCERHANSSTCRTVKDAGERKQIATEKKLCFKCLELHPRTVRCNNSKPCVTCNGDHHEAICHKNPALNSKLQIHAVKLKPGKKKEVSMMVIQAPVANSNEEQKFINTNLFLDCGAASSFIRTDVAKRLKLPVIEDELLELQRFGDDGSMSSLQVMSKKVSLVIMAQNNKAIPITAYTINNLTNVLPTIDPETRSKKLIKPDILIGNDYFWEFFDSEKSDDGYQIVDSLLGKMVCGSGIPMHSILLNQQSSPTTNEIVEKFFQVDQAGADESPYTKDEDIAVEKFIEETEIVNGRMQCRLPFTVPDPPLDSLRNLSFKCFESQLKKLAKRPDLLREMDKTMKQQLNDQITEVAPKTDSSSKKVYLPHHAIETPHKSTKVRIVFNSSAKATKNSKSLNDWLYAGPSLIPEIPGLLLRIRLMEIFVSADVEKAFLQLGLHPDDRDFTRFFWIKDVDEFLKHGLKYDNIIELRFCTIFFGAKSSPFSLNAAIRKLLLQLEDVDFATQLKKNTYVDNVFIGGSNSEEVIQKTETAVDLFKSIKMNLRDIMSHDTKVNDHFNVEPSLLSVLGLQWNPVTDTLTIKMPSKTLEKPVITKRDVLAEIGSKYDPLGMLTPVMVRLKLFMQELWKRNTGWDEKLSAEEAKKWKQLIEEAMAITFDRYIKPVEGEISHELLIFCDASIKAYAAVAYLLTRNQLGETKIYLIMSKSKIAPVKAITIPRLELLALLLGAKLLMYIIANILIQWNRKILLTDSSAVFYWLRSNKPLKRFVDNRVNIIKAAEAEIRHVPTKENPADIASRGSSMAALKNNELWWHGPAFLKNDPSKWPNLTVSDESENSAEIEKEFIFAVIPVAKTPAEKLISVKNGSTWNRLVRVTAYCMHFVNKCRKQDSPDPRSTQAFKLAEKVLIKDIQNANFPNEATCRSLRIFKDETNMLRCRSRLEKSDNIEMASPLFLPRSEETNLLILKIHYGSLHAGARHVLTELRQNFWLPKGLSTVKKAIKSCRPCLKFKAKPYQLPEMPALPSSRITKCVPFQHIGVDCAGPFNVKINGVEVKVWIVLFTCLTTRAVVLDMVKEMSAIAFINALRRFASTYGTPLSILSDNGSNFKATGTHVTPLWHETYPDPDFMDYVTSQKIHWNFITERAPWKGGIYERLVGCTKSALKHGIGRKKLNEDDFKTLLFEVQGFLNSRPLTEAEGEIKAIRPIDFILPNAYLGTPRFDNTDEAGDESYFPQKSFKEKLLKTLISSTVCLDRTWTRWRKEYLTKLRETSQFLHKQKGLQLIPEVGEIVLIEEDEVPRGRWRMGKIIEVHESRDGHIREVVVQTANGHLLNRSPIHLYSLEANLDPESRKASKVKESNLISPQEIENCPSIPAPINENRRITRSMKSTVNSLFFFLTLCQLFLLTFAGSPIVQEAYCKHGEIVTKTVNVSKISVHLPRRSKLVQVQESTSIIPIPIELLSSHSKFETMFWSNTGESVTVNIECEVTDFCELVTCIFCQDHITHPHCWEWTTWLCLFFICMLLVVWVSGKCYQTQKPLSVKGGRWLVQSMMKKPVEPVTVKLEEAAVLSEKSKVVKCCNAKVEEGIGCCCSKEDTTSIKSIFKPSIKFFQRKALLFSIIMLCLLNSANACSDSSVIQAKSENCLMMNENHIHCNFSIKSWMSLSSGREGCLLLQSDEKVPVGTIKMSIKAYASCKKYEYGMTKFMKIKVKSAKRCPGMGSCTSNNCAEVYDQSRIQELGNANDYPGITGCVESCGSATCGCALFGTGCTFFRYYAETESDDEFKLYSCSKWEPWYNITVSMESHNSTYIRTFKIQPGQSVHVDDIKISVRKASVEFLNEFPTKVVFIEKDNEIAWLNEEATDETLLFSCEESDRCRLRRGSCNCHPADSTVQCSCDDQEEMKDQWTKNKLPSHIGEHLFLPNLDKGPLAHVAADVDLVVETFNLSASTLVHYTDCSIVNTSITGTNGPEGALLKTFCKTQFGYSVGHVYCKSQTFDVKCSKNGTWSERRWYTNNVIINEECLLTCQVSQHRFEIKGHLHQKKHSDDWKIIHGIGADNTSSLKEFGIGFLVFFQHLYDYILYIIGGIAVILVVILLLK
uniref:Integrase catalytic domain-containing protein n=1 Tax=Panagrolaimus davidi TaxID=227884 RepID=A0A914QM23_9BILA